VKRYYPYPDPELGVAFEEDADGDWVRFEDVARELEFARQDKANLNSLYVAQGERANAYRDKCELLQAVVDVLPRCHCGKFATRWDTDIARPLWECDEHGRKYSAQLPYADALRALEKT
jgi:hypothetical protein